MKKVKSIATTLAPVIAGCASTPEPKARKAAKERAWAPRTRAVIKIIFLVAFCGLTGCAAAPQQPIPFDVSTLDRQGVENNLKVGIVMTDLPTPDVFLPGANCLLCIAVAEANHQKMSKHVDTFKTDDLFLVKTELALELKEKGIEVVVIDEILVTADLPKNKSEEPNASRVDFSQYKESYGVTHLLVVDIGYLGLNRQYAGYMPQIGAWEPYAVVGGLSYLVDLHDNSFEWYFLIAEVKRVTGEWDEPPAFPALTNAYYQALEMAREAIVAEF